LPDFHFLSSKSTAYQLFRFFGSLISRKRFLSLLCRTSFDLDEVDYDSCRICVLASQGFHIYLNGHKIHTYIWWKEMPHYRLIALGENEIKHLKKGKNVLAIYSNTEYPSAMKKRDKIPERAQIDCYLEGLRKKDLGL